MKTAATAAQIVGILRALSRRCEDAVIHLHEPDDDLRALVLEIEARVPECCRVSLGGVVTTIEVVTGPERTAKLEVFDRRTPPAASSGPWQDLYGLRAGQALCSIVIDAPTAPIERRAEVG